MVKATKRDKQFLQILKTIEDVSGTMVALSDGKKWVLRDLIVVHMEDITHDSFYDLKKKDIRDIWKELKERKIPKEMYNNIESTVDLVSTIEEAIEENDGDDSFVTWRWIFEGIIDNFEELYRVVKVIKVIRDVLESDFSERITVEYYKTHSEGIDYYIMDALREAGIAKEKKKK